MQPRVGIVTPCRNRREKTARFLSCVAAQQYRAFRMYLVDSNSTDGTPEMVRRCFPFVEVLAADDSKFWTGATNLGVRRALQDGCDYILTINDDSVIGPEWLATMVSEALGGGYDILASRIDYLHRPGLLWALGASNDWKSGRLFQLPENDLWADECPVLADRKPALEVETLCGNGVLFRRAVFERTGLYDEVWTPHYHADSEFVLRARRSGFRPFVTARAVVRNDVFNDAAVAPAPGSHPPPVRPGDWKSVRERFAHDFRKLFLNIRSDYYWRALLIYVWRHCPRPLLARCTKELIRLLWRRHFEGQWRAFRPAGAPVPEAAVPVPPLTLWRVPLSRSRAPVPRGELSMELFDRLDEAEGDAFVDAAYAAVFERPADENTEGFRKLAETPEGRWRVLDALLDSVEAEILQLGRRVSPLARRMLRWKQRSGMVLDPVVLHGAEDVERLTALSGREMVETAYRELLGRSPEAAVLRAQTEAAEQSAETLAGALLLSAEYNLPGRPTASRLIRRWSLWTSARSANTLRPVGDVPVQRLANSGRE